MSQKINYTGETLIGRDRVRGSSRVLRAGTKPADVNREQIAAIIADAEAFRRKSGLSLRDLATAVGYSLTTLASFLRGEYNGNNAQLAIDLDAWLAMQADNSARPATTQFVWTDVAMLIKGTIGYAMDMNTISMVYGPNVTGIGKTMALAACHEDIGPRRSALITLDKVDASPAGLLKKLCMALRVPDGGGTQRMFSRCVQSLKGRSFIILLDQVQNLCGTRGDKPFFILCDLFDATNVAQLWCGTTDLLNYLNRQRIKASDESLSQITRRIFPAVDLYEAIAGRGSGGSDGGGKLLVSVEQVKEMFAKNQLRLADDAPRFLAKLISLPDRGGVGLAVQLVKFATMAGNVTGKDEVTVAMLRDAMRNCMAGRAEVVLLEIEERPAIARAG